MGGRKSKPKKKINYNDGRAIKSDQLIWSGLLELATERKDDFSFTAKDIMRKAGRASSGASITRERGGITNWFCSKRNDFINEVHLLVAEENTHTGDINLTFCRRLGFLISTYYGVVAYDIISSSHRSIEKLLEEFKPLIKAERFIFFGAEFYVLLSNWYSENRFSRESVLVSYGQKIKALFLAYQLFRPHKPRDINNEEENELLKSSNFFIKPKKEEN